jgi:hypothetical protein
MPELSANRALRGGLTATILICLLGCVAGFCTGQEPQEEDGLWPTPRMIQLITERVVNDMSLRYGLDEQQKALLKEQAAKRVPQFMEKHQAVMKRLLNEVVGQNILGQAPTVQQMADWSKRALPVAREGMDEVEGIYRTMRPLLRPEQAARWGRDHFTFRLGYSLGEAKLRSFAEGRFDPREWRTPLPGPHQSEQDIMQGARKAGFYVFPLGVGPANLPGAAAGEVSQTPTAPRAGVGARRSADVGKGEDETYVPPDQWESYTKKFIAQRQLDEGQRIAAVSIMKEMRQRATDYRKAHRSDYARLQQALTRGEGGPTADVKAELSDLDRPVQDLFKEFRDRLDQLLTESQRRLEFPDR